MRVLLVVLLLAGCAEIPPGDEIGTPEDRQAVSDTVDAAADVGEWAGLFADLLGWF